MPGQESRDGSQPVELPGANKVVLVLTVGAFLFSGIFFLIGAGLTVLGLKLGSEHSRFLRDAARARGQVVELKLDNSGEDSAYYPVVRFETADGRTSQFQSRVGTNPACYAVGQAVEVLYDKTDPKHAEIDSFLGRSGPLALPALGVSFAAGGLFGMAVSAFAHVYVRRRIAAGRTAPTT